MPEYLAPAVYVEEVDTGSKPIEGVSTSTCGMVGVTERGPLGVPVLVTSYGEYRRWFGDALNPALYGEHRFMPHAVDGFFTNGGKRVYVTRVLAAGGGNPASALLFQQADTAGAATQVARAPAAAASALFVADALGAGIAAGDWVRIGTGSEAEYRQAAAVPAVAATSIAATLPLQRSHAVAANGVERYAALPGVALTQALVGDHRAGAGALTVAGAAGAFVADRLLQIQRPTAPATREELIFVRNAVDLGGGTSWRLELETPLQFDHEDGEEVNLLAALAAPAPADVTTLDRPAVPGDGMLVVPNNGVFAVGEFVRVVDGARGEFRRIGDLHAIGFGVPAPTIPAGTYLQPVTTADDGAVGVKRLDAPVGAATVAVAAGALALSVNDRQGLAIGQLLRVGAATDPDVEYVVIRDLPNPSGAAPDAGRIVLETALARAHGGASAASRDIVALQQAPTEQARSAVLIHEVPAGASTALASAALLAAAPTPTDLLRLVSPGGVPAFLRIAAHAQRDVQELMLATPLLAPHAAPQPVIERQPLLGVFALDPGVWGNRLRVAAARESTPLVRSRIRADATGIQDPTHVRLDSAAGVEIGTVLSLADALGQAIGAPFKVVAVDRQNGHLLTLDAATPLPAAAALGSAVVSIEFTLTAYLLRQPDPAQPSRDAQVFDAETFRHLSLDERHSRYVQRVVGTTFAIGAAADDDGRPLRRADRRSEGESAYIRVRDNAQDLAEPARTTALRAIRLGPEFLVDSVDGRTQPARRALANGDDQIAALTDADYVGLDDPEPERRTGLQTLRNIDEISVVAVPGRVGAGLQAQVIAHCELMRYRFAVLDGSLPPADSLADIQAPAPAVRHEVRRALPPVAADPRPVSAGRRHGARLPGAAVGPHARRLRPHRHRPRRAQGAGQRGRARRDRPAAHAEQGAARHPQPVPAEHQRDPRLQAEQPRHPRLRRARHHQRLGLEVRQRAAAADLHRGLDRPRAAVGGVRAQRRAAVGARAALDRQLPDAGLAQRRAGGHQARGGVLRQVRPHDDDADRHRPGPADLPGGRGAGEAGRVRDRAHRPVDRARRRVSEEQPRWPPTNAPTPTAATTSSSRSTACPRARSPRSAD
ncbi:MAG: hypothetical protein MZW92_36550 [Comamonadaceae bacterium]|nr:hypothetical protein [Comamonadaceae bacterium]